LFHTLKQNISSRRRQTALASLFLGLEMRQIVVLVLVSGHSGLDLGFVFNTAKVVDIRDSGVAML